jgi:hypothetical protein
MSSTLAWAGDDASSSAPSAKDDSTTADSLARRIVENTGDPEEVETLTFEFVYEADGEVRVRRRHVWHPNEGRVTVSSDDRSVTLTRLHDYDLSKLARSPGEHEKAWRSIAPDTSPKRAAEAWSQFVNDSYWLLMPSKLFDPGVNRTLDDRGRLKLTFGDVGLTPGDTYWLTVDRDAGRIEQWSFRLQDGREGTFEWRDYRNVGPLELSTTRVAEEGSAVIRFEGVEVEP